MLPEHIRLETKQVVATALAQRMITPAQAELVMQQAAEYERRGEAHLNVASLMQQLNLINAAQAAQLVQMASSSGAPQTFSIGKYLLTNKLGAGAMGTVYLAVDQTLQRKVALKILSSQLAALPEFVGRFKKEARTTAQLNHRNIVHVYDVDETDGFLFYAMEYLEGAALDDILKKRGILAPSEAVPFVIQAAKGLEAAHKAGIVHRDVKPANLFLTREGTVKLVDLGLSKDTTDAKASEHSMAGMAIGTPHYIAPEQARGLEGIDGRADIYGLGCTLFTLLTGRTPYSGPNPVVIMNKQINEPPPDPCSVVPTLPAAYTVLIELMMAKNPNDRYQNCTELIADLERVLAGKAPMGASVALANEGAQDVPTLKRRAVTAGSRGPMGGVTAPRSPTTGRIRPATAVALDKGAGDGSSGFRRLGPPTRRTTSRFDRIEPRSEDLTTGEQELPFFRRYTLQIGIGAGAVVLILLVMMTMFSGNNQALPAQGVHVASHTDPAPTGFHGPVGPQPVTPLVPSPVTPPVSTDPGHAIVPGSTPAPTGPLTKPDDMSPYEWSKLHPVPVVPPTTVVPVTPETPARPWDGRHSRSYTPPPDGYTPVLYLTGREQESMGSWFRVEAKSEDRVRFLRWTGVKMGGGLDMQFPYFKFNDPQTWSGNYVVRGMLRRNGKGSSALRIYTYGPKPDEPKINTFAVNESGAADAWFPVSVSGSFPKGSVVDQFEIRASGRGEEGETIDVDWIEVDQQNNVTVSDAQTQPATAGKYLHMDCGELAEDQARWRRCTVVQEGKTAFVHWTYQGNHPSEQQITSPMIDMDKGFTWGADTKVTVRMRLRARGTPRFNIGLKVWYHNSKNTGLVSTGRIDFTQEEFGEWVERTVTVDVNEYGVFNELEIRPYENDVPDGSVDIDWVEILPRAP